MLITNTTIIEESGNVIFDELTIDQQVKLREIFKRAHGKNHDAVQTAVAVVYPLAKNNYVFEELLNSNTLENITSN